MQNLREHYSTRTPQSRPLSNRQALNNAGGYAFPVDDWTRLDRFLILGTSGGTYYQQEKPLTVENAQAVQRAIVEDGERVVARVVEISDQGRAPKNDPALFVLAMCAAAQEPKTRAATFRALPQVARIGTHLFHFAHYVEGFRGWGRGLRRAVARWYEQGSVEQLALQAVKYRQRDGWSHRDMLRLAHPNVAGDEGRAALFEYICRGGKAPRGLALIDAVETLNGFAGDPSNDEHVALAADLIRTARVPREAVPTELLHRPEIWAALLQDMPLGATVRTLNRMTAAGLIKQGSEGERVVIERLADEDRLRKARLHPLAILLAQKTYEQGHGERGKLQWTPSPAVVDALDDAFYCAFRSVRPTGKRLLVALDVSGSMSSGGIAGTSLTPRAAASALALVALHSEQQVHVCAFAAAGAGLWASPAPRWRNDGITPLALSKRQRLTDVVRLTEAMPFGGTDCALPMLYAMERGIEADAFLVLTDSETWAGAVHPCEALREYRARTGIPAKMVVVAMTSSGFTIADPEDGGMMDVVGFDAAVPEIVADFIRQ